MPNCNRRGPENLGPKTGVKLGKCKKSDDEKFKYPENRPFSQCRRKKSNCTLITQL